MTNAAGTPIAGFSINAASGVDWLVPVPLPPAAGLMVFGLIAIALKARRQI